ncbi:hypothetical protein HPB48_003952 [Haemaphysalis longicornis]|uniref:Phosphatidylethanolamine-binding protein n=1 Tax=Haemaphysalis longicornis TaxID=44386 RepID=A0A9J6GT63_HAELO|nr:hypothetical protein HPB48_003952 [Haemaphysalis longicornis]
MLLWRNAAAGVVALTVSLSLTLCTDLAECQESDIKARLANLVYDGVIEDLTHFLPVEVLYVYYKKGVSVLLGNQLSVTNTSRPPEDLSFNAVPDNYHTVLLVDVDAPSRSDPTLRSYRHWLVVNVPSNMNIPDGTAVTEYIGPRPAHETGKHRMVFLLYSQVCAHRADAVAFTKRP